MTWMILASISILYALWAVRDAVRRPDVMRHQNAYWIVQGQDRDRCAHEDWSHVSENEGASFKYARVCHDCNRVVLQVKAPK